MTARHGTAAPALPPLILAVLIIGAVTLSSLFATTGLLLAGREAPEGLVALASGGIGSLSTFLARTRD